MDTVRLRHSIRNVDEMLYFYDGELPVKAGLITIPADRPEWISRAWMKGFRLTPEGRVIADLDKHIAAELARENNEPAPAPEAENAKSEGDDNDDEGTDAGRQPADDDGLRAGEQPRSEGVSGSGDDGGSSDEPPKRGGLNFPAHRSVRS